MTVSIPLAGFNRSGGVKTLVLLANAMVDRGWTVRLLVPDYASEPTFTLRSTITGRVVSTSRFHALAVPLYYLKLAWYAARGSDLCVASFYMTAYCALLSKLTWPRARLVYFLQGDEAESHGRLAEGHPVSRAVRYLLARVSYRLPMPMICISRWLRDRVGRPDSLVVGQGLDLRTFAAAPRAPRARVVVGTIGGAAVSKGYPDVLEAVRRLPGATIRRMQLLVAAGPDVALPGEVCAERVEAASEEAMASFYNRCDVFVFASRSEGFGLPPLEAMACGCAVVTTDCGGVHDYAQPGVNALLVPVADAGALAAAIRDLVERPDLREALARAAPQTAAPRDRERMLATLIDAMAVPAR